MGLWNLTKAEARKIASILRIDGIKMPKVGYCVSVGGGEEVCRDPKGYYLLTKDGGEFERAIRQERGGSERKRRSDTGYDPDYGPGLGERTRRRSNPGGRGLAGATPKQQRQYEAIKKSALAQGYGITDAKAIAAATVNKGKRKRKSREGKRKS
jgi:hypothetical protein